MPDLALRPPDASLPRPMRQLRLHRAILVASILASTACIPNHRPESISPPLVGSIRNSDNSPASGMLVAAVASDWHGSCRKVAKGVTTDSTGAFEVPASYIVRRVRGIQPPSDGVHVAADRQASTLRAGGARRAGAERQHRRGAGAALRRQQ